MSNELKRLEEVYKKEKFSTQGLTDEKVIYYRKKYGANVLLSKNKITLLRRIINALCEPMMIILVFAFLLTLGINIGNYFSGYEVDPFECLGIFFSICISVGLTVIMECKSEKAFEYLKSFTENISVKCIRNGEKRLISNADVCVGDVLFIESGERIVADCLILEENDLEVDESTLTGESVGKSKKQYNGVISEYNLLNSGTFVKNGNAKVIVLAVGESAKIGNIASGLASENDISAPLSKKLNALSKKITIFGAVAAIIVFIMTISRAVISGNLSLDTFKTSFLSAIVLIVAAVPEGLPTTVAISLALSVVKLAKSNAVIKKLIAAETVGCVSVICSDKTGTLTFGVMEVEKTVVADNLSVDEHNKYIALNSALNSTACFINDGRQSLISGNSTERALISYYYENRQKKLDEDRARYEVLDRVPFSSERKYTATRVIRFGKKTTFYKGAIEVITKICNLTSKEAQDALSAAIPYEKSSGRIIAFAHEENERFFYDGFAVLSDKIRPEVKDAVIKSLKAGIKVKILTGDNKQTAFAIAKKLGLAYTPEECVDGRDISEIDDEELIKQLNNIKVVARCMPQTKLRIVKLLKKSGEIVAVTGDGVNDAPAVKNADVGIAMGDGSEITKEAADVILLNNSFSVIVKAIAFGRNIYRNFQSFLFFQLTVNFTAVGVIIAFLLLGFEPPFNALQLLWINVIMDGPLALSLGLEKRADEFLEEKPVKRTDDIVSKKAFMRIILHSVYSVILLVLQKTRNFLDVNLIEHDTAIFCLFVFLQLFNSINARELGGKSVFSTFFNNKLFIGLLITTFVFQITLTCFFGDFFDSVPLNVFVWIKITLVSFSVVSISELYKAVYKRARSIKKMKKVIKKESIA